MSDDNKPRVLVLGGCGFIGRHIVAELIENEIASFVRAADKVPPPMAWFNSAHTRVFAHPDVHFQSVNLINEASCFACTQCERFDWVINAAGETKTGQEKPVYREGIMKVTSNAVKVALSSEAKVYVEVSSGQMSESDKHPLKESDDCNPWSIIGQIKLEAEKVVQSTPGLKWIIVRPAIVYGPADKLGLTPRMLVGGISRFLNTEMKLLWDHDLKMNTVHVKDVARAIVWLCQRGKTEQTYHLVDDADSTQDSISKLIASIFDVEYKFCGNIMSRVAMSDGSSTVQFVNEKHLEPWLKLCTNHQLHNTPLTPYVDLEALHNKPLFLDGDKIRGEGFDFRYPKPSEGILMDVLEDFIHTKLLPTDIYDREKRGIGGEREKEGEGEAHKEG